MPVHSESLIPSIYPSATRGVTGISGSHNPLQSSERVLHANASWRLIMGAFIIR
jgi:hypothetical protein